MTQQELFARGPEGCDRMLWLRVTIAAGTLVAPKRIFFRAYSAQILFFWWLPICPALLLALGGCSSWLPHIYL